LTAGRPRERPSATFRVAFGLTLAFCFADAAIALGGTVLPQSGRFVVGQGTIGAATGDSLVLSQSSRYGIIDWRSFSIGAGGSVAIQNGAGATLNRVTGGAFSSIFGTLSATGSVYLINPQGIVVGPGGRIVTGGSFVASTRDISDTSFLSGGTLDFTGATAGTVTNEGTIRSLAGDVLLIGRQATNTGSIAAPSGTAALAAGDLVLYDPTAAGARILVKIGDGNVTNSGVIAAAEAELRAADGNVYALAGNDGGIIGATGTVLRGGHVWLTAGGNVTVAGSISAKDANGSGGIVETSGGSVTIKGGSIAAGSWLIDPSDLIIDTTAAGTIAASLTGGTNVMLETTATATSGPGTVQAGTGDIDVAASIVWTGAAALKLSAYDNIVVEDGVTIANSGSGTLALRADNAGQGTGTVALQGSGHIDFSASTGTMSLYYNPSSFGTPTPFAASVLTNPGFAAADPNALTPQFTAYMLVNSAAELEALNGHLSGDFALGHAIDAGAIASFVPIGSIATPFTGILEGAPLGTAYTISNVKIDNAAAQSVGLFGVIGSGGMASDVTLSNEQVTAAFAGNPAVTRGYAGGLAGQNAGAIVNSSASGSLQGTGVFAVLGGLVGDNLGGLVSGSSANMTITAGAEDLVIGGLAGRNESGGKILASQSSGSINDSGADFYLGGLVGQNLGTIAGSQSITDVAGSGGLVFLPLDLAGGLAGMNQGQIASSMASGKVGGGPASADGGLVGENFAGGKIDGSSATGAVSGSGNAQIGGLVGDNNGDITDSQASGDVTGTGDGVEAGGFVGQNNGTIADGSATGTVTGDGGIGWLGGFVGWNAAGTITLSYAKGDVMGSGAPIQLLYSGGLAGENSATILQSYATGAVSALGDVDSGGVNDVGGLVGFDNATGVLTNVYATGAVSGGAGSNVGGLFGYYALGGSTDQAYETGTLTGGPGGSVGDIAGFAEIGASFPGSVSTGPPEPPSTPFYPDPPADPAAKPVAFDCTIAPAGEAVAGIMPCAAAQSAGFRPF
jgi:filamentous hemagglutinin family protein